MTKQAVSNYIVIMKTTLVKIGNSQGIRIPKPILEQCGLQGEVEIEVHNQELVIRSAHQVRQNWGSAFEKMARLADDSLLDVNIEIGQSSWDDEGWEWS